MGVVAFKSSGVTPLGRVRIPYECHTKLDVSRQNVGFGSVEGKPYLVSRQTSKVVEERHTILDTLLGRATLTLFLDYILRERSCMATP